MNWMLQRKVERKKGVKGDKSHKDHLLGKGFYLLRAKVDRKKDLIKRLRCLVGSREERIMRE